MEKAVKKINVEKSVNFDREDILIDILSVKKYLSRKGYFSNDKDFKEYDEGILHGIKIDSKGSWFTYITKSDELIDSLYFIPEVDAVFAEEKKEKKLRPYEDISEFWHETGCDAIGRDTITVRNKVTKQESTLLYVGYSDDMVYLGGCPITFKALHEFYEFYESYDLYDNNYDEGEWLPFGIEVNG